MKIRFSIDGRKTTRRKVKELVGEKKLNELIQDAKDTMKEDPLIECDYYLGISIGTLTIQMDPWS